MMNVILQEHAGSNPVGPLKSMAAAETAGSLQGQRWELDMADDRDRQAVKLSFQVETPPAHPISYGLEWSFAQSRTPLHTLMPGALYAGNRFEAVKVPYSPRYPAERVSPTMPLLLTDVPRLERYREISSKVHLRAGDLSWPAFACWDEASGAAFLVYGKSHTSWGETLWELEEPAGHRHLCLRVTAPAVRPLRYLHMDRGASSSDRAHVAQAGDRDSLELYVVQWHAADLAAFHATVFEHWSRCLEEDSIPATLPLSCAYETISHKYECHNWHADWKLYLTVIDADSHYPYQTGWCGGGIAAYALLGSTDPEVQAHARANIDTVCGEALTPTGLLFGKRNKEGWVSDFNGQVERPHTLRWTLARRQGDALFYLGKAIIAAGALSGESVPPIHPWRSTLRTLATALVRVWEENGQWGHFLDNFDGHVYAGGTCSGAIIPGGLALAAMIEDESTWRDTAVSAALQFRDHWTQRGITAGGPGDALGNIDSESAAALVETYTWLWQTTGDPMWLQIAIEAAHQLATWVMPYAYPFPAESEFGRLDLISTGTVFANTQNKHSAPGICTHSGEALLRLFRASGDQRLLDLLRVIVRALPQFISREDRPIYDPTGRPLPPGWINERVNTSDWDNNLGGVFFGSCWCEVSLLLSWVEIPGIYAQTDSGLLCVIDHIEASWEDDTRDSLSLQNPTAHPARVKLLVESNASARTSPLPVDFAHHLPVVNLAPGETRRFRTGNAGNKIHTAHQA